MMLNRSQEPRKPISNFRLSFSLITVGTLLVGLMIWPSISSSAPLPGQIIVDPNNPAWLKYNAGGPFFMCGPGDPEGFLYRGTRNPDGTREGDQMELINRLKGTGANCIYLMAVRSHGGDGGPTENPFIDSDPGKGLDQDILGQWETWFTEMDNNGIVIFFIFYDDSARIWDTGNSVGGAEQAFLHAIVDNFEHHKNLIWCVAEEYSESYTAERVRNIAAEIRAADEYDHVIAVHKLSGIDFSEFADDPNIDQFAIQYIEASASELHDGIVAAWNLAAGRYNLNMSESANYGTGPTARQKNWAVAMGGAYVMGLGWDIASTPITTLEDCGRLVTFMESTNFNEMAPHDELKFGGTEYVLALPGESYIAYASNLSGDIGLQNMTSGLYDLTWSDVTNGTTVVQTNINVEAGNVTWSKPVDIGNELAVYIRRLCSELIIDFCTIGLYGYDGSSAWSRITVADAEHLVVYGSKLVGDFGSAGLWEFDGTSWTKLTPADADNSGNCMVAYGTSLIVDLGTLGLWQYDGSSAWSRITPADVQHLVVYGSKLVGDFGSAGLWEFDGTSWIKLTPVDADNTGNCMVVVDFK